MKDLPAIAALYTEVDNFLDGLRDAASRAPGDTIEQKLRINDQAYFVLAWGQLEGAIDDACRRAIEKGRSHRDWRQQRSWSLYNPQDRRLSGLRFEDRTAFVRDTEGREYALAMQHYNIRNQIAHGTLLPQRIDVTAVAEQFFVIQAADDLIGLCEALDTRSHTSFQLAKSASARP